MPHIQGRHEVRNFLSLATQLNCSVQELGLEVWWDEKDRMSVREVLAEEGISLETPLIVLHPEAGRRGEPRRRWPQGRYVALANALVAKYGVEIVLTGAPDEVAVSEEIAERTKHRAIVLAGRTDVNQLAGLFADATLVVSGNCGPMHLAAAVGTPVIGLHGSHEFRAMGGLGVVTRVLCVLGYRVVRVLIWDLSMGVKHFRMGHRRVCTRLRLRLCFGSVRGCWGIVVSNKLQTNSLWYSVKSRDWEIKSANKTAYLFSVVSPERRDLCRYTCSKRNQPQRGDMSVENRFTLYCEPQRGDIYIQTRSDAIGFYRESEFPPTRERKRKGEVQEPRLSWYSGFSNACHHPAASEVPELPLQAVLR